MVLAVHRAIGRAADGADCLLNAGCRTAAAPRRLRLSAAVHGTPAGVPVVPVGCPRAPRMAALCRRDGIAAHGAHHRRGAVAVIRRAAVQAGVAAVAARAAGPVMAALRHGHSAAAAPLLQMAVRRGDPLLLPAGRMVVGINVAVAPAAVIARRRLEAGGRTAGMHRLQPLPRQHRNAHTVLRQPLAAAVGVPRVRVVTAPRDQRLQHRAVGKGRGGLGCTAAAAARQIPAVLHDALIGDAAAGDLTHVITVPDGGRGKAVPHVADDAARHIDAAAVPALLLDAARVIAVLDQGRVEAHAQNTTHAMAALRTSADAAADRPGIHAAPYRSPVAHADDAAHAAHGADVVVRRDGAEGTVIPAILDGPAAGTGNSSGIDLDPAQGAVHLIEENIAEVPAVPDRRAIGLACDTAHIASADTVDIDIARHGDVLHNGAARQLGEQPACVGILGICRYIPPLRTYLPIKLV